MKGISSGKCNRHGGHLVSRRATGVVASAVLTVVLVVTGSGPAAAQDLLESGWIAIQSYNFPDHYVRHRAYLGELTKIASSLDQLDSTFRVVKGLAGRGTVSFESRNFPGYFLRHHNLRLKLHKFDGTDLFRQDASFLTKNGLALGLSNVPVDETLTSYESINYPGYYIRHRADTRAEEAGKVFHLYIEKYVGSAAVDARRPSAAEARFRRDCTFRLKPRRVPPAVIK